MPSNFVEAWWHLSLNERYLLAIGRALGAYGGTPGRAPYFWIQEGTFTTPLARRAIRGKQTYFVTRAVNRLDLESIADNVLRNL